MQPTKIRLLTAAMLTVMACLLYLDRYAVGIASQRMRSDLQMTQTQMSWFLSSFFWAYALSQVPAGWLSDRFGPRMMLAAFIVGWSLFTGLLGATTIVALILLWRFLCGATQAGAFPVASGMIRSWFPVGQRGLASSVVAVGGRVGAVVAPLLTAQLMATFDGRWQMVLMLYGGAGIVVALAFALSCRDTPAGHPLCNDEERSLIAGPPWDKHPCLSESPENAQTTAVSLNSNAEPAKPPFPLVAIITSVSLWGNSLLQLFTNIGWLFVVTWLPRYLEEVHEVPL
ncbi:MAG TPA: MFS transporter, partial [Pirellulaceae bacterium]|nr:MFS transporter [Pirellulaceae bacterium]